MSSGVYNEDTPSASNLEAVVARFAGQSMTVTMRLAIQSAADEHILAVLRSAGEFIVGPIVGVLVGSDSSLAIFVDSLAAVDPMRRAGYTLTPFRLLDGRAVQVTDETAMGWEIGEPTGAPA